MSTTLDIPDAEEARRLLRAQAPYADAAAAELPRLGVSGECEPLSRSDSPTRTQGLDQIWRSRWPEAAAACLALGGLLAAILTAFHPREWQTSGSDFKTLYAAALCFRQHIDPYNFHNIADVFAQQGVVPPTSWYAHAPVYPPFTLAAMAPLTLLPMVPAVYAWLLLSFVTVSAAFYSLSRAAEEFFGLGRGWRLAMIAVLAASPLLSFGLVVTNVSPLVAALCMCAVALPEKGSPAHASVARWWRPAALTLAMLLKPHLALWAVVALFVSRRRADRRLALQTAACSAVAGLLVALWMAAHGQLLPEAESYRAMVHAEVASGSMSAANHELVAVAAQITSVVSLLGYWMSGVALQLATAGILLLMFGGLLLLSLQRANDSGAARLTRMAAWSAFGMVLTYHRAHDGLLVLAALPYMLARLRACWYDMLGWAFALCATLMSVAPRWETFESWATHPIFHKIALFLLYRQAPLFTLLLLMLLVGEGLRLHGRVPLRRRRAVRQERMAVAA